MEFVLASHNRKKLKELGDILGQLGVGVRPLPEDAPEPAETGETFEENALIKARAAAMLTGLPAIADDSGLCVDALGGAPGVYSARYGSEEYLDWCRQQGETYLPAPLPPEADDVARCQRLLEEMAAVPDGKRNAQFVCAIACVLDNGDVFTVTGACEGEITRHMEGAGGFGYDPLFFVPSQGCTFGQLPQESKNEISHRARALHALAARLKNKIQE